MIDMSIEEAYSWVESYMQDGQTDENAPESTLMVKEAQDTSPERTEHLPSPMDMPVEAFQGVLARRGDNRKALMAWVRENMKIKIP